MMVLYPQIKKELLIITVMSLVVRFLLMHWHGLDYDESEALAISSLPTFKEFITVLFHDGNPPLFYFLLRAWIFFFGQSDVAIKALSLLISGCIPPLTYLVIQGKLGQKIAWLTAILAIFCPQLIGNTSQVRPYGIMALLNIFFFDQIVTLLNSPGSIRERVKYILLATSLLYTHITAPILVLGHVFLIAYGIAKNWWQKKELMSMFVSFSIIAILYLPILMIDLQSTAKSVNLRQKGIPGISLFDSFDITVFLAGNDIPCPYFFPNHNAFINYAQVAVIIWLILTLAIMFVGLRREQSQKGTGLQWLQYCRIVTLSSVFIMFLFFVKVPCYSSHYETPLAVFFALLIVTSLPKLPVIGNWLDKTYASIIMVLVLWLPQFLSLYSIPPSTEYELSKVIKADFYPDRDLIICTTEVFATELVRVLPPQFHIVTFPDVAEFKFVNWPDIEKRMEDETNYARLELIMSNTLAHKGRIWLVANTPLNPYTEKMKKSPGLRDREEDAYYRVRQWLLAHAVVADKKNNIGIPARDACATLTQFEPGKHD